MNYNSFKEAVIAAANEYGVTDYELYYSSSDGTSVSAFKDEIDDFRADVSGGVCFRCINEGKMGYASTEKLSEDEAKSLVRRAADNALALESDEAVFLGKAGQEYEPLSADETELPGTSELVSFALRSQKALYAADEHVTEGTATSVFSSRDEIAIFNSNGLDLHAAHQFCGAHLLAVVTDGSEKNDDHLTRISPLQDIDLEAEAAKVAASAVSKLGGDTVKSGVYPVVFAPEAMSSLLGTFSVVFSSENAQRGLSRLAGREGDMIAAPAVTLVDDPFYPENPVKMNFDAEGSPAHRKNIIENGRLNTLLYNLKTAAKAGRETTGNASKASYSAPVEIRPFTMYVAPGAISEDGLLKKAGSGVYINYLGGLHAGANVISGDFSLQSAGFLIEDGKKTTSVKSFTVAGNFYDLLKMITDIADNIKLSRPGSITGFASPAVLVDGLSVAGK